MVGHLTNIYEPRTAGCESPLPAELGTCVLIPGFLDPGRCAEVIAMAEARGFAGAASDYPPSYRNNDRQVLDDEALATELFRRMRGRVPERMPLAEEGAPWELSGLNERIRVCRYRPGQRFGIHQDGVHHRGPRCRSLLTFMIYLTDGGDFEGGDTLFYAGGPGTGEGGTPRVVARVRPRAGSLIVFDHRIWHAGDTVRSGVKHILRSDLIYRRTSDCAEEKAPQPFSPGHEGYVWALARLADAGVASGGRDACIRIWRDDGRLAAVLRGHSQSVLGLTEVSPGTLASVSRDRTLRFWNIDERRNTHTVTAHGAAALALARLPGARLASGGADGCIGLWGVRGEAEATLLGHRGWVWSLAAVEGDLLASASEDGSVRLWHTRSRTCIALLEASVPLRSLDAFPPTARSPALVASGDIEGIVRVYRLIAERLEPVAHFAAHAAAVRRVRWLSDGTLATCSEDNRLRVWRWREQRCDFEHSAGNFVTDALELPGGRILSAGYGGEITAHDRRMGGDTTG
jgi:WD40 repeat protein